MKEEKYSEEELEEIRKRAIWFKIKNFWRLPGIIRGHKVANRNPGSKVSNFSTITTCFPLSSGRWVYLVYAYPLSIIHRLLDGLMKWATEKYCIKVINPRKWKEAFVRNSFIPIIPIDIPHLAAMPYIENENLLDILTSRIGNYTFSEKKLMIQEAAKIINDMHAKDIVWGELVVPNMIRSDDGEIIICDTETVYYRGSLIEQKTSDWFDFIYSSCGLMVKLYPEKVSDLIQIIVNQIQDGAVRQCLKEICGRKRSWLHRLCFLYTQVRVACPPKLLEQIKTKIRETI